MLHQKTHFVLDLETLGTTPTSVVTAIGIQVVKSRQKENGAFEFVLGESFYTPFPYWDEQIRKGRTVTGDTVKWLLNRDRISQEAVDALLTPSAFQNLNSYDLLGEVNRFLVREEPALTNRWIWGNGSDFDNVILGGLFNTFNMVSGWEYWNNRCFRTLKNLSPVFGSGESEIVTQFPLHHALGDAQREAFELAQILNQIQSTNASLVTT